MNRRPSEWQKWVKMHVIDGVPMTKLAAKYRFDVSKQKYYKVMYNIGAGSKEFSPMNWDKYKS